MQIKLKLGKDFDRDYPVEITRACECETEDGFAEQNLHIVKNLPGGVRVSSEQSDKTYDVYFEHHKGTLYLVAEQLEN